MDDEYLPHLKEVKIQEEPYPLQDGLSVSYESEYTKFKFSMGGNIKFYDEHIASTSPRKKIQAPSRSLRDLNQAVEVAFNSSLANSGLFEHFGSMDMTPRILNATEKEESDFKDKSIVFLAEKVTESNSKSDKLDTSAQICAALGRLRLSDNTSSQANKTVTSSPSVANSIAKVDSWKTDFSNSSSLPVDGIDPLRTPNAIYISDISDSMLQRREITSSGNGARARDYSPIRSTAKNDNVSNSKEVTKTAIDPKIYSFAPGLPEKKIVIEREHTGCDKNATMDEVDNKYGPTGDITYPERLNRYNRTLLYVNEQNETLKNGDFNELAIELTDLSSDVFTDSEIPTSGFLSQSRDGKSDLDFYPDSPTTEQAFSKTPCSSRKNSLESYISDESHISGADLDLTAGAGKSK